MLSAVKRRFYKYLKFFRPLIYLAAIGFLVLILALAVPKLVKIILYCVIE